MKQGDFFRTVVTADLCGLLTGTAEVAHNVFVAGETVGWRAAAREFAAALPGQVRPSMGSGGLTWYCGAGGPHGVVIDVNQWQRIKQAREIGIDIGALDRAKPVWSLGAVARSLLAFAAPGQPYEKSAELLLARHPYGYHECAPGRYPSRGVRHLPYPLARGLYDLQTQPLNPAYRPGATLYDVSGYYYQMLTRLPSLRVSVMPHPQLQQLQGAPADAARPSAAPGAIDARLKFWSMRPDELARWRDVLSAVESNKPLRNSLAGVCAGSVRASMAYTSARPNRAHDAEGWASWTPGQVRIIYPPGQPGPFRAAGLLLVATGAELCYRECLQVDAIYATIDSVATVDGRPSVWAGYGFEVRQAGAGAAEFCHRGSYRIGPRQTKIYARQTREYLPQPRTEVPDVYAKQWL